MHIKLLIKIRIFQFGCKDTTNYSNMQGFFKKNIVYARISSIFLKNTCCLHDSANVISEGTHPEGEGACRNYNISKKQKKRPI